MADIFFSYASEDRDRAARLARVLEDSGWSVWWDRRIVAGESFDHAIERELEQARCVIVLWTAAAIASEWVKNEAAAAAERGVLVPALLDPVRVPLEFRRKQTAELVGWDGDPAHEGFRSLRAGVAAKTTTSRDPRPQPVPRPAAGPGRGPRRLAAALAVVALALGLAVWGWRGATRQPDVAPAPAPAATPHADLADLVAGTYHGAIVSDARGGSRSDVTLTIIKVGGRRVRITSDAPRLGTVETELDRVGNTVQGVDRPSMLLLELDKSPRALTYSPDGEVVYDGKKR